MKTVPDEPFLVLGLNAEELFIAVCLRAALGEGEAFCPGGTVLPTVCWDLASKRANELGVASLLYGIIKDRPSLSSCVDKRDCLLRELGQEYGKTWAVNVRNSARLSEIVEAFSQAGIKVILLKGAHLANFVYRDPGLRPMIDLDILIKETDFCKAGEILAGMGYEQPELSCALYGLLREGNDGGECESIVERYKIDHPHLPPFSNPRGIRFLDLHWMIVVPSHRFRVDIDGLWARAQDVKIDGADALILSPEDAILHLALHNSISDKFKIFGLKAFCDIAACVGFYRERIDWDEIIARASAWGVSRFIYLSLRLTRQFLSCAIPEAALHQLRPHRFNEGLTVEAARRVLRPGRAMEKIYHPEAFSSKVPFGRKIFYVLGRIFPPPGEMERMYALPPSSKRTYLYYPVRVASLLHRYLLLYVKFFLYLFLHKDTDPFSFNLDTYLSERAIGRNTTPHGDELPPLQ